MQLFMRDDWWEEVVRFATANTKCISCNPTREEKGENSSFARILLTPPSTEFHQLTTTATEEKF